MDKKTDDLLKILNRAETDEALARYMTETSDYKGVSFVDYFNSLLEKEGISKAALVTRTGIERTYLYQLLNGTRQPSRDYAIAMCIAAGLSLEQTTRCLELLSEGILYAKNARDAIIIYAINREHSVDKTNELLFDMGEEPLRIGRDK